MSPKNSFVTPRQKNEYGPAKKGCRIVVTGIICHSLVITFHALYYIYVITLLAAVRCPWLSIAFTQCLYIENVSLCMHTTSVSLLPHLILSSSCSLFPPLILRDP